MTRAMTVVCCVVLLALAWSLRAQDSTSALINQALDQPVKLELNTVLPEAMSSIATQTGVRIEAEPAVWNLLPWGQQTNITAKIENQSLRQALEAITRKLGLVFVLKDEVVQLQPMPALRRLGRRSTIQELQALDLLSSTPMSLQTERPTVRQLVDAVDQKLLQLKAPFAIESRLGESVRADQTVFVPRNATMGEALESLDKDTNATWYPWGKSIVVLSKIDQLRNQLSQPITTRYTNVDVLQVLTELCQRAGVPYQIEPGAIQRIPQESRSINLQLDNASIKDALENIAGFTGLSYALTPRGIYISNQSVPPRPTRDPAVGLIMIPDLGIQAVVPQSQVPADLREYIKYKTDKELAKMRQMMKDENFTPPAPATKPAAAPSATEPNSDL